LRTIVSCITAEMETFPQTIVFAERLEEEFLSSLHMLFILLTIVCVVSMFVICNMSVVQAKMPQANAKFTGARMMLMVMEVQKSLLSVFTLGSPINLHVKHVLGHEGFTFFSPERYFLLHVTLLTWECLGIVSLNVFWWKPWSKECFERAQLTPGYHKDNTGLVSTWQRVFTPGSVQHSYSRNGAVQDSHLGGGAQSLWSSSDLSSEANNDEDDDANINDSYDADRHLISDGSLSEESQHSSACRILSC